MPKKILLSISSIFLIWQSYKLLNNIHHFETDSWPLLIFMAWIINMFITGIFAFAGFAFPTQRLMPKAYYKIYQPELLTKIHNILGVEIFRKFLLATVWRNKKQRKKFFNGKRDGIAVLEEQSMKSEFGHLIPLVILTFVSVYLIVIGLVELGILCMLINIIGNFYPILLQRHHRMRIELIREKRRKRKERNKNKNT